MIDFPVGPDCGPGTNEPNEREPQRASRARTKRDFATRSRRATWIAPTDGQPRGFQIEDGEIECTLLQHAAIADAVVLWMESSSGPAELVAYCVAEPLASVTAPALRQFLLERLPSNLMLARIHFLPRLPRTADGMIDRRTLPS